MYYRTLVAVSVLVLLVTVSFFATVHAQGENASDAQIQNLSIEVEPSDSKENSTHNWSFTDAPAFSPESGNSVDSISVDYPAGTSLDGLNETDITVVLTRELASGPDRSEIDVNSDEYSGSSATFDLSGFFTSNVNGSGYVKIQGVQNPSSGEYNPTMELIGEGGNKSVSSVNMSITDSGSGTSRAGTKDWSYDTGSGVFSSPTVVNGTIYIGSGSFFDSGSQDIYALDKETGQKKWSYTAGDNIASSPAVVDGTVYVGSFDNDVYAIDAKTGNKVWNYTVGNSIESSPTVVNGTVYVGSGSSSGSGDEGLYAIDAETGKEKWNYTTGGRVEAAPTVYNNTVYFGSFDNKIYAVVAETGQEKWNYSAGNVGSAPTVVGGTVYVGSYDNNLYALDTKTGNKEWSYKTGDKVDSAPTVADGAVYIGSYDNNVYSIDADTGQKIWSYTTGDFVSSSPTFANGTVYVGSLDNSLYAIDAETGQSEWNYTASDAIESSPTVSDGTVYVGSRDNNLYSINTDHSESSTGSRVLLGALGHTNAFAERGPTQPNIPPDASFNYSPKNPNLTETVSFNASNSSDPDGLISKYSWSLGDKTTVTGETVTYSYSGTGEYTIGLTVTDDQGGTDTTTKTVNVRDDVPSAPDCSQISYQGNGTEQKPYEVNSIGRLQCIKETDLNASYVQVSDIDASFTSEWNSGGGFNPIGEGLNTKTPFNGTFDGQGYNITGLTIDRGNENFVGLFGSIGSKATVMNVSVVNANVTGSGSVGGIAGDNSIGTVSESSATGSINGSLSVGGLVGSNYGGKINKSYAKASVNGSLSTGGLVGFSFFGSTVSKSYATGSVNGTDNVGGLLGANRQATVSESYATGSVNGTENVSALVGKNSFGTVALSYATGSVDGARRVGGLIGSNEEDRGTVRKSYWDTETTGQASSDGGTGLKTSEMTGSAAAGNMTGFDFTDTWKTVSGDYPILAFQTDGSPSPPYFDISIDSTNSPVVEGNNLTMTVTVTNTGSQPDTQTVMVEISGLTQPLSVPVTLEPGNSTTKANSISTEQGDAGVYSVEVSSENSTEMTIVEVIQPGDGNFTEPLPNTGFENPPQNIPVSQGGFNDSLVEDLDGDGDGLEIGPAIDVFGEIFRRNLNGKQGLGLSLAQAKRLNWNSDSPSDTVTINDMISLFGEKFRKQINS